MCEMAGMYPSGIVCEIMNDDGTMSRMETLEKFAYKFDLKILSIAQIIAYRRRHDNLIERVAEARLPTKIRPLQGHRIPQFRGPGRAHSLDHRRVG